MRKHTGESVTIERVQRALITAALLVEHHGPAFAPIFERLERELAAMQNGADVIERAKRMASLARS